MSPTIIIYIDKIIFKLRKNGSKWKPSTSREPNEEPDNIKIEAYEDDDMIKPRRYEIDLGWKDEWIAKKIYQYQTKSQVPNDSLMILYENFLNFKRKWYDYENKENIPKWYKFDPNDPEFISDDHNMVKQMDKKLFNFLAERTWIQKSPNNNNFETSELVVNFNQLLGIGGEGMVIRKITIQKNDILKSQALKIIPILSYKNEESKINEVEIEKKANDMRQKCEDQNAKFSHNSLVKYNEIYLDNIINFEEKIRVLVICKFHI